jgi:hypothetical protein
MRASSLLVPLLMLVALVGQSCGCRSEASSAEAASHSPAATTVSEEPTAKAPASAEDPALVGVWKPCTRNADCEAGQQCATVGRAGEGRCALQQPSDLAIIVGEVLETQHESINPRYLGKLLVLNGARLKSRSICTLKGCSKGCCNLCSEYVHLDSQALQTDAGRLNPFVEQGGQQVLCPGHNECVTTTCPRAWRLDEPRQIVGSFRDDNTFELLSPWL